MKELRLGEELRAEIEALRGLDSEAFEQIAAIAAAQLRSDAPGAKAVKNAAAALAVGPEKLAAALEALSFVIAEAARLQLPEQDLRAALQEQLPLSGEAVGRLVQVAVAETPRARSVASDLGHPLPAMCSIAATRPQSCGCGPRAPRPSACHRRQSSEGRRAPPLRPVADAPGRSRRCAWAQGSTVPGPRTASSLSRLSRLPPGCHHT